MIRHSHDRITLSRSENEYEPRNGNQRALSTRVILSHSLQAARAEPAVRHPDALGPVDPLPSCV